MKDILFTLFLLIPALACLGQPRSEKRGLAYGQNSKEDLEVLSKGVSWWYNWHHQPEGPVLDVYENSGFDYVTMAWNGAFNKPAMQTFLASHPDVKYILGWNEPNFIEQANMKPSEAAAKWKDIEAIADEFDLKIASPAVNFCGTCVTENGVTYTDPVKYLDDFFSACTGCRVDYIAIHSYMGTVDALKWYVGLFKKYGKPIWLTEFAHWEGNPTLEDEKKYLIDAVEYLESDDDVFRYAWFTGRRSEEPFIGILADNEQGKLTTLGEIYVNLPVHDPEYFTPIPSRVEAEAYARMNGVSLEPTNDLSSVNVKSIDAGDWMEYAIDVPETGDYAVFLRIAAATNGLLRIKEGSTMLASLSVRNTGGLQKWETIFSKVHLAEGHHTIRVESITGGSNLNWIEFMDDIVLSEDPLTSADANIYPNPIRNKLIIENASQWRSLEITDLCGRSVYSGTVENEMTFPEMRSGFYVFVFTSKSGRKVVRKFLKE